VADYLAKYTDGIKKMFKDFGTYHAEVVVAVNEDGTAIGGGGGGEVSGEIDVTDRVGRLVGVVSLDAAALTALENTTVLIDAASLAGLESISVQNNVSTDMLDRVGRLVGIVSLDAASLAALESITAAVSGTITVGAKPKAGTDVTIANAANVSGGLDLTSLYLVGLRMPAAWTAADIVVQASPDGVTWFDLYDQYGNIARVTAEASRTISLVQADFACVRQVRLHSVAVGANTDLNQGADRVISLITVPA
jgi:hypothetical protein